MGRAAAMKYMIFMPCIPPILFSGTASAQWPSLASIEIDQGWRFRQAGSADWLPAAVPGMVHMDLFHNKKIGDPFFRTNEKYLQWID
jgi:beta-mannosidase